MKINEGSLNGFIEYGKGNGWWKTGLSFKYLCNDQLFKNIDLDGKSILDVGAGRGLYSLWSAVSGAKKVVALEPSVAGSRNINFNKELIDAIDNLKLTNIKLLPDTFQNYNPGSDKFDLILLKDSINHLSEAACMELQHNVHAQQEYITIFNKILTLLSPGGTVIITDCSNRNFFADIKLSNPLAATIDWKKHQSPVTWEMLLFKSGFKHVETRWHSPAYFLKLNKIFDNALVCYFMTSWFRIEARAQS